MMDILMQTHTPWLCLPSLRSQEADQKKGMWRLWLWSYAKSLCTFLQIWTWFHVHVDMHSLLQWKHLPKVRMGGMPAILALRSLSLEDWKSEASLGNRVSSCLNNTNINTEKIQKQKKNPLQQMLSVWENTHCYLWIYNTQLQKHVSEQCFPAGGTFWKACCQQEPGPGWQNWWAEWAFEGCSLASSSGHSAFWSVMWRSSIPHSYSHEYHHACTNTVTVTLWNCSQQKPFWP